VFGEWTKAKIARKITHWDCSVDKASQNWFFRDIRPETFYKTTQNPSTPYSSSTTTMNSKAIPKKRTTRSELGPVADESVAKTPKKTRSETTAEPLSPSKDVSRRGGRPAATATPTKAAEGQKRETLQDAKNEAPPTSAWTCECCKEVFALEIRLKRHQSTSRLYLFLFCPFHLPPPRRSAYRGVLLPVHQVSNEVTPFSFPYGP